MLVLGLLTLGAALPAAAQKTAPAATKTQVDGITNATLDRLWSTTDDYWHEGDYNRIVDLCRIVMEGDPSDDEACSAAAYLLWSMGDTKAADWILDYGGKRAPGNKGLFQYEMGWHLFNTKRYKEAIPYLQKAVTTGKIPLGGYTSLGHAYEKTGDLKSSLKVWQMVKERFPSHPSWKPNLARVKAKLANAGQ
jgi:tetratricopeptide (TPR) repeat protein